MNKISPALASVDSKDTESKSELDGDPVSVSKQSNDERGPARKLVATAEVKAQPEVDLGWDELTSTDDGTSGSDSDNEEATF